MVPGFWNVLVPRLHSVRSGAVGAERVQEPTEPTKPPPSGRHECSVDSGTNEQRHGEFCLKSQLATHRQVRTINGVNCTRRGSSGLF